jgi:hypothetical protein
LQRADALADQESMMRVSLFAIASVIAGAAIVAPVQAQAPLSATPGEPAGEMMMCRGPFIVGSDRDGSTFWTFVEFEKNAAPAGANGTGLMPGRCAFLERTITEDEPARVSFLRQRPFTMAIGDRTDEPQNMQPMREARQELIQMLQQCRSDASCILRFQVMQDLTPSRLGFEASMPWALVSKR